MKTIFTVFNANGELVDSPAFECVDEMSTEVLQKYLPAFRLGGTGNGITLRAKDYLAEVPNAAVLAMVRDSLLEAGVLVDDPAEVAILSPYETVLNKLNGIAVGSLNFIAQGDAMNALYQLRDADDKLVLSLPVSRAVPEQAGDIVNAVNKIIQNVNEWMALEGIHGVVEEAKGQAPGVRMLTPADIQTMFGLTFPGYSIPDLESVVDHPAKTVSEILSTYGEADSASNALTREHQLGDGTIPAEKAEVASPASPATPQPLKIKPEDFNYDRDREELARTYNVRFRGIILNPDNDPFLGTYLPRDLVHMSGQLCFLSESLDWVKFKLAGNGGSWRIWLASVAGKRPISGPGTAQEVEVPPAGKPLSIRSELAKLAQTAPLAEKPSTTLAATNDVNPFYFITKAAEVAEHRVVVRGVARIPAVEQGIATFLQRELKAASLHAASSTFNLTTLLSPETVVVATRTALQMLGLNAADIDVEPSYLPLNPEYEALMA